MWHDSGWWGRWTDGWCVIKETRETDDTKTYRVI